jgi:signal transduction histidine kinase
VKDAHPDRAIAIQPSGNTVASVDADRFAQVLSNLIGNALQHGDRSEPVTVTVDGSAGHAISIGVRNRGAIDPHRRDVIFDPFRTASEPGARAAGLGLGLFIARQLMRAHGGDLTLIADDPDHTVFVARLPR